MKGALSRILVISAAFTVGTLSVLVTDSIFDSSFERAVAGHGVDVGQGTKLHADQEDPDFTKIVDSLEAGDFYAFAHGCGGNGTATGYITAGRRRVSRSYEVFEDSKSAAVVFWDRLSTATIIIDEPATAIRDRKPVRRVMYKGENDGVSFYVVMWIGKGQDGVTLLAGPDEATVRRFEEYIIRLN